MPHNISSPLRNHINSNLTTTANLWKISRTDSVILAFTNHMEDITYNGTIYKHNDAIDISSIATKSDFSSDNMDLVGFLKDTGVSNSDIMADVYDGALVEVLLVDYTDLTKGHLVLKTGYIGEISQTKDTFTAEVRGLTQKLEQNFGELYSPTCRARLGDGRCKINMNSTILQNNINYNLKNTGIVNQVINNRLIIDNSRNEPISFFNFGFLTFTSGENIGKSMEIKNSENEKILLFLPLQRAIRISDTFIIQAGCDKFFNTCIGKFNNAINFRAEPHLPGRDKVLEFPKSTTTGRRYEDGEY